jgi:hypothetical protein
MSAGRQEAPGQRTRESQAEGQITGDKKQHSQAGGRLLGRIRADNWAERGDTLRNKKQPRKT